MKNDYLCLVIRFAKEIEEDIEASLLKYPIIGSELLDLKTLSDFEEDRKDWELYNKKEVEERMRKKAGFHLEEGSVVKKIYFTKDQEGSRALDALQRRFYERFPDTVEILMEEEIIREDWGNEWKKYFAPIPVGSSLVIMPSWLEAKDESRTVVYVDPGMAFGTGNHESTLLCLEALEGIDLEGKDCLDLGSGSGILSIYMKKKGARRVVATDIDQDAIDAIQMNAKKNNVDIEILLTDLFDQVEGKFDVICANLLLPLIQEMGQKAAFFLNDNGILLVSGILVKQEKEARESLDEASFMSIEPKILNEWLLLEARKRGEE